MNRNRNVLVQILVIVGLLLATATVLFLQFNPEILKGEPTPDANFVASDTTDNTVTEQLPTEPVQEDSTPTPTTVVTDQPVPEGNTVETNTATDQALIDASAEESNEVSCLVANFPTFYNFILISERFDEKHGFNLNCAYMGETEENDYNENQQAEFIRTGQFDMLATTGDTFGPQGGYGRLTLVTDLSTGADVVVAKQAGLTINDLQGLRVAVVKNSVSEFFLYTLYSIVSIDAKNPDNLQLVAVDSPEEALEAYLEDRADVIVTWIPILLPGDGDEMLMVEGDDLIPVGYKVIGSDQIPVILDGVIVSTLAIQNKTDLIQKFHDAWFDALQFQLEHPDEAAQVIIDWDVNHNNWTELGLLAAEEGFGPEGALRDYMWGISQAKLTENGYLMNDHAKHQEAGQLGILAEHLTYTAQTWSYGGVPTQPFDPLTIVEPRFVIHTLNSFPQFDTEAKPLFTDRPFLLYGQPNLSPETVTGISEQEVIATLLGLEDVLFKPGTGELKDDFKPVFEQHVHDYYVPAMRGTAHDVKLVCAVGAAWPKMPEDPQWEEPDLINFLNDTRIPGIRFLMVTTYRLPEERLEFIPHVPTDPDHIKTEDHTLMAGDRFINCELIGPAGL